MKTTWNVSTWMDNWSGLIGKATFNPETKQISWRGHWQGRHGQQGKYFNLTFEVKDGFFVQIEGPEVNPGNVFTRSSPEHRHFAQNCPFELAQLLNIKGPYEKPS